MKEHVTDILMTPMCGNCDKRVSEDSKRCPHCTSKLRGVWRPKNPKPKGEPAPRTFPPVVCAPCDQGRHADRKHKTCPDDRCHCPCRMDLTQPNLIGAVRMLQIGEKERTPEGMRAAMELALTCLVRTPERAERERLLAKLKAQGDARRAADVKALKATSKLVDPRTRRNIESKLRAKQQRGTP